MTKASWGEEDPLLLIEVEVRYDQHLRLRIKLPFARHTGVGYAQDAMYRLEELLNDLVLQAWHLKPYEIEADALKGLPAPADDML